MAGTTKGPRIVDALADIARELRLSNQLHALKLGASVLQHDDAPRATSEAARARIDRKNAIRADVRAQLGLEAVSDDHA